jgi:hypothetical protein
MLGGHDAGARRDIFRAAPRDIGAADDPQQPETASRIGADEDAQRRIGQDKCRQRDDHMREQIGIKQGVEQKRSRENQR